MVNPPRKMWNGKENDGYGSELEVELLGNFRRLGFVPDPISGFLEGVWPGLFEGAREVFSCHMAIDKGNGRNEFTRIRGEVGLEHIHRATPLVPVNVEPVADRYIYFPSGIFAHQNEHGWFSNPTHLITWKDAIHFKSDL